MLTMGNTDSNLTTVGTCDKQDRDATGNGNSKLCFGYKEFVTTNAFCAMLQSIQSGLVNVISRE